MWDVLIAKFPGMMTLFCTFLAFAIPYVTYKVNQKLHKAGDPPWKKQERE